MDRHVIRRILHGLGAGAYGQLVIIVVQLVGVPILLHAWGAQLYGEWLILAAIPTYLSMTDLGFSQSAGNDMTARMARGDTAGTLAVFQSLSVLVYALALIGLLIATLLFALLPLQHWFHLVRLDVSQVRWILWLLAAEVLIRLVDGVNHAGFRSHGDYALHVAIASTTMLLQMASIWLLALAGYGPVAAAAAFVVLRVAQTPLVTALLLRRHRDLRLGLTHARFAELRRLSTPALANLSMPMAVALNMQGMVLVIGATLGPLAVVVFSTLRTLTGIVRQGTGVLSHAFEPEFAAIYGRGDGVLLRRLFGRMMLAQVLMAVTGAALLLFAGRIILGLWTHDQVAMDARLFHWLLLSTVMASLWHGALTMLKSANLHVTAAAWFALSAALSVAGAYVLLLTTGKLHFAGLAYLLGDVLTTGYVAYAAFAMLRGNAARAAAPRVTCL